MLQDPFLVRKKEKAVQPVYIKPESYESPKFKSTQRPISNIHNESNH